MRKAETILNIVIQNRGKKNLVLDRIYRLLYHPTLFLKAYGRISANKGAMTQGVNSETVDEMSLQKINAIIEKIKYERYRWLPVRRRDIPKANGKTRPLGIPCWSDKLLQEVMRSILEAYYDPQFSDNSHGFRPNRGCHTALKQIKYNWHGTKWFIEGDIKGYFNNINHEILMGILQENIKDNRFLRLIHNLLKAGYINDYNYYPTMSGTPQGGIISPILANIYLDKLDKYVEMELIPKYTQGKKRAHSPEYDRISNIIYKYRRNGLVEQAKHLEKERRAIPSNDQYDPKYRRLYYVRYADDFLLGFIGPKEEAIPIKEAIRLFLEKELLLELSEDKTLLTHARDEKAKFLGHEISISHCDSKITSGIRSINGNVRLSMPTQFVKERMKFYMKNNKPHHRMERTYMSEYSIICQYQSEYRGFVQYYQLAENIAGLSKLHWAMRSSLLKTIANKRKSSTAKIAKQLKAKVETTQGPRKCLELIVKREKANPLIARFGGIPLICQRDAKIQDQKIAHKGLGRTEILKRLLANTCEQCGSKDNIEVHHIRKLSDLKKNGRKEKPDWIKLMAAMKRKTLVLCRVCHRNLHAGRPLLVKVT